MAWLGALDSAIPFSHVAASQALIADGLASKGCSFVGEMQLPWVVVAR
jgi:hypothetical protein